MVNASFARSIPWAMGETRYSEVCPAVRGCRCQGIPASQQAYLRTSFPLDDVVPNPPNLESVTQKPVFAVAQKHAFSGSAITSNRGMQNQGLARSPETAFLGKRRGVSTTLGVCETVSDRMTESPAERAKRQWIEKINHQSHGVLGEVLHQIHLSRRGLVCAWAWRSHRSSQCGAQRPPLNDLSARVRGVPHRFMCDRVRSRLTIWVLTRKTDAERNLNSSVARMQLM